MLGIFRPDIGPAVAAAYEQSMLFSEHTWGLANQHYIKQPFGKAWDALWDGGLPPQFQLMEKSWQDHAGYVDEVRRLVETPYEDAMLTLADNVNVSGGRVVVYNPLPWKRDGEVTLNVFNLPRGICLRPVEGGPVIAISQEGPAVEGPYSVIRFVAKDVPPLGYRTYVVADEKPAAVELAVDETASTIESPFFRATLDGKRGRIASLIDKRSGRELVDAEAPQGFGQYFYERFGYKELVDWTAKSLYPQYVAHKMLFSAFDMPQDAVYSSALPENMTLSMKQTPDRRDGRVDRHDSGPRPTAAGLHPFEPAGHDAGRRPGDWLAKAARRLAGSRLDMPALQVRKPEVPAGARRGRPGPAEGRHGGECQLPPVLGEHRGGRVRRPERGGRGALPAGFAAGQPGRTGPVQVRPAYEPKKPYVYLNLYNNQWRSNFAAWIGNGGRMTSRVRLWTFDKFQSESALYTPAMEARVPWPPHARLPVPAGCRRRRRASRFQRKGVAVTAFGPNPDGPGTVLRVWEQGGAAGPLTVMLPPAPKLPRPRRWTSAARNAASPSGWSTTG